MPPLLNLAPLATQDEKARSFFLTVPQQWRLFWLMNIISISFALALAGIAYVGDASAVNAESDDSEESVDRESILEILPTWFVFAVNPAAMTFFSLSASRLLQALCDTRASLDKGRGEVWLWKVLRGGVGAVLGAVRLEPCFYAVLFFWVVASAAAWWSAAGWGDSPLAVAVSSFSSTTSLDSADNPFDPHGPEITKNVVDLVAANLALAVGSVVVAVRSARDRAMMRSPRSMPGPRHSASRQFADDEDEDEDRGADAIRRQQRSRVPSLLVGWGLGYWVSSLLYLVGSSWPRGAWAGAPLLVDIVGYVLLPLTFLMGVFLVAESNVYGAGVERVVGPVARALGDKTRVLHWAMVTVMRDVIFLWMILMYFTVPELNII